MADSRSARRLACAALVAGLWGHGAPGHAEDAVPQPPVTPNYGRTDPARRLPPSPGPAPAAPAAESSPAVPSDGIVLTQAPTTDRALTAGQETSGGIAFGAPPAASDEKSKETCWSKVPDLRPQPRPGLFLLPPSGPGFYTLADAINDRCLEKAPPYPYRLLCFDNDFRYLDRADGKPVDFFDNLKRIHLCGEGCDECGRPQGWMLSVGGEERLQIKNEIGGANGRLNGLDNNYQLLRTRVYGDLWYKDIFRVYVEYIDAQSYNQDLPPLAIDVNHSDIQNAFFDLKVAEIDDHPVYARVGRQELLYGSQRLISPLDWANTRRTFEGAKLFWHSDKLDVDGFWVRPVVVSPSHFDAADANRQFAGLFTTYRPVKGQEMDAYYLYLDSDLPVAFGNTGGGRGGYNLNTFGSRWAGDHNGVLWEAEGGYQFGNYDGRDVVAGFATGGLGYAFSKLPMQPQFWAYFDYASGSPNRSAGTFETFNQLFPFGHYYFGYLDEIGRENIHDWNFQATFYPAKWITGLVQYHVFRLDQAKDALYGPSPGYPTDRFDPTGKAGTNVGQELDVVGTFNLDRHNAIMLGYSKFFSGDFIRETGTTSAARSTNPEFFYMQYSFRW